MTEEEKARGKRSKPPTSIDLGFGALFRGLGDFIDLLSEMAETGAEEVSRTGEFRVKGLGEKGRGVYGFTVRTGIGGIPRVEHFGNVRVTEEGPEVADVREPLVDVFDEDEEILVVAELPGVGEEDIQVEVHDDVLSLEAIGNRKYAKEILLTQAVDAASMQKTYKNGILNLRFKKVAV